MSNNELSELQELQELRGELKRVSAKPGQQMSSFTENFVQMPESDGLIIGRILPSRTGRIRDLFCSTRLHTLNGKHIHCPREIVGERWQGKCPICEKYSRLWKESDTKPKNSEEQLYLQSEARKLKPNERYYYNFEVKQQTGTFKNNQPNKTNVPLILSVGKQVHAKILKAMLGSEEEMEPPLGKIYDPEVGRDFKIIKKSKHGTDNRVYPFYDDSKFLEPSSLGSAEHIKELLENLHDLQALRSLRPFEELQQELWQHEHPGESDDTSFTPSNFEKAEKTDTRPTTTNAVKTEVKVPVVEKKAEKQDISDEDAALLEDEFLKSLDK